MNISFNVDYDEIDASTRGAHISLNHVGKKNFM